MYICKSPNFEDRGGECSPPLILYMEKEKAKKELKKMPSLNDKALLGQTEQKSTSYKKTSKEVDFSDFIRTFAMSYIHTAE